ncbi:hypothetical protein [Marinobacter caseinilyticus]|uniref:hypothetical protein n=1 Tax=Marinobacter caseinilyticus TaxID=2692195 RepID=UPI00140E2A30|nr:hypothetical protein [Marinobacter caseinilyticus]
MDNSTSAVSPEEIGRVAMQQEVKKRALSVVKRKLGHIFGTEEDSEVHQIAQDALNDVTMRLLSATHAGTTSLKVDEDVEETVGVAHPIARYLILGVSNYCAVRLQRWSVNNRKGNVSVRARYIIDTEGADDSEFWDQHVSHGENLGSVDDKRVDSLLTAKGVSGEDLELIKRNLAGWSFVDLAAEHGGTADKYRRRIQRALDKAGIDPALLG